MDILSAIKTEMNRAKTREEIEVTEQAIQEVQKQLTAGGYTSDYDAEAHRKLAEYSVRSSKGEPRGLFAYGHCGTGKTMFVLRYIKNNDRNIRFLTAVEIAKQYIATGATQEWEEYVHGHYIDESVKIPVKPLIIDDLGNEPTAKRYGETREILDHVMSRRYAFWQDTGVKTYVTSNLTGQQLDDKYGRRVTDRLREMCFVVKFEGKSARRQ